MPLREGGYTRMETLSLEESRAAGDNFQAHWYRHVAELAKARGKSVLDAGAGTGYGLRILLEAGIPAAGFDVTYLDDMVSIGSIEGYADGVFGWVVAMDVIEHVEKDREFLGQLLRVARDAVFISTPNWNVSKSARSL